VTDQPPGRIIRQISRPHAVMFAFTQLPPAWMVWALLWMLTLCADTARSDER
jgi:hypothetical protein